MENNTDEQEDLSFLNLLILVLSFYVLGSLLVGTFFQLPFEITKVLSYIDNVICLVFFIDFVVRFRKAKNKLQFMKWGWIDLVSSIPTLDFMRAGRLLAQGTPSELSGSADPYVGELLRTPRRQAERLNALLPRDGAA